MKVFPYLSRLTIFILFSIYYSPFTISAGDHGMNNVFSRFWAWVNYQIFGTESQQDEMNRIDGGRAQYEEPDTNSVVYTPFFPPSEAEEASDDAEQEVDESQSSQIEVSELSESDKDSEGDTKIRVHTQDSTLYVQDRWEGDNYNPLFRSSSDVIE